MSTGSQSADVPGESHPASPMLIDRYLRTFDVTQIEHVVVDADVDTTWAVLIDLDLLDVRSPLLDAAFFVRGLPARLATLFGRIPGGSGAASAPTELKVGGISTDKLEGWLSLGQATGKEIAFGAIGRFWRPSIEWYDVTTMTAEQFAAFDEPGWGRIAANFSLRPYGENRTLVSYEARTATTDPDATRRFARYWGLVRPFVGHVQRAALDSVRRNAERLTH